MPQLPARGEGTTPYFNPMGCHSEVFLHAPRMPKIAGEGGVGVLPCAVLTNLLHCLLIQAGYLTKKRNPFDTDSWENEEAQLQ